MPGNGSQGGYDPAGLGAQLGEGLEGALQNPRAVFPRSMYPGMSGATQSALSEIRNTADSGAYSGLVGDAMQGTQSLINHNGFGSGQHQAMSDMFGFSDDYANLGREYGDANPYFEQELAGTLDRTGAGVNAALNNAGRFGSSAHVDELTRSLAGTENTARLNERNAAFGREMAALGGEVGATGNAFNMGQTAVGNQFGATDRLGGIYDAMMAPSMDRLGVGQIWDQDRLADRLGDADLFDRTENADRNNLLEILGAFTGSQGNAGMSPQVPWWERMLGFGAQLGGTALGTAARGGF